MHTLINTFTILLSFIKKHWLAFTIFNVTVVSVLSLIPLENLQVPGSDKTHHLISYCLLIIPCALVKPKHWILLTMSLILWSGTIELIQPFVNRHADWLDFAANGLGVLLGLLLAKVILSLKNTLEKT